MKRIMRLVMICLICTFLVACQPNPEETIIVNKNEGVLEEKIHEEVSGSLPYDAPKNINEEVYIEEGKYSIIINADIENLTLDAYPVYLIIPDDFTQTEVDTVIQYFFKDSPLYDQKYTKSKSIIADQIVRIRADMQKMDPNDKDDIEGAENAIKKLEEEYESAPETVARTQITSKLIIPSDVDYEALNAYADLGYTELSSIGVSNRPIFQRISIILDKSRYFLPMASLSGKKPDGQKMTPDEAWQKAEEALAEMGIKDMTAVKVETGMTEDQKKQGYVVTFKRSVNGVPIAYNIILDNSVREDFAAKWPSDLIAVRLDDKGISAFAWTYKGKILDELTANVEMPPFDEIMDIARQQLKSKFAWSETNGLNYYQMVHVDDIVLEYTCARQKDNPNNYLLIPAWNFYGGIGLKYSNGTVEDETIKGLYCVLSLNAVDGSVIGSSD